MLNIRFTPPGPVAAEFLRDRSFVSAIMGPVGSGKSSTAAMKLMLMALEQPFSNDGVQDSRWIVTRNTYGELKSTTLKTWLDWFPDGPGGINTMRWDAPITSTIQFPLGNGKSFKMENIFIALDKPDDLGKLRSLEATGAWMNEAVLQPKEVLDMLTQRIGRYPSLKNGPGAKHPCVIMDTNSPDDDHWYYGLAEEKTPAGWRFFKQPGGLRIVGHDKDDKPILEADAGAENVINLLDGYDYYFRQAGGKDENWIKVFLCALYGTTMAGKPVYPEWRDAYHVAKQDLKPIPGLRLKLGWDFGLTPACIIGQITPRGQMIIIKEIVAENMGIRQFARECVKPVLQNEFGSFRFDSFGDPAGRTRVQTDEKTCFQELLSVGIATEDAPTNSFIARRESVAFYLNANASGEPAFLLSPCCTTLRRGFNGGYRYERMRVSGIEARFRDMPAKDKYSHPHDALQYLALSVRDGGEKPRARAVESVSAGGWT